MPRIEIIPEGWETSQEKAQGDGTPTINVCKMCLHVEDFITGNKLDQSVIEMLAEDCVHVGPDDVVGALDVEHPEFEMEGYDCDVCGEPLTSEDN